MGVILRLLARTLGVSLAWQERQKFEGKVEFVLATNCHELKVKRPRIESANHGCSAAVAAARPPHRSRARRAPCTAVVRRERWADGRVSTVSRQRARTAFLRGVCSCFACAATCRASVSAQTSALAAHALAPVCAVDVCCAAC